MPGYIINALLGQAFCGFPPTLRENIADRPLAEVVSHSPIIVLGEVTEVSTAHWFGPVGDEQNVERARLQVMMNLKGAVESNDIYVWLEQREAVEPGQLLLVFGGPKFSHLDAPFQPPEFANVPAYADTMIPLYQNSIWTAGRPSQAARGWNRTEVLCWQGEDRRWLAVREPASDSRYCTEESQDELLNEVARLLELGEGGDAWAKPTTLPGIVE